MSAHATTSCLQALGTYVFIGTRDPADLAAAEAVALEITQDIDETCSRFREDSDLTRVNNHPGEWVEVDPLLAAAVRSACDAARQTDGMVNPLLGRPLALLGYDRDFQLLSGCDNAHDISFPPPVPDVDAWQSIAVDPEGVVRIPSGTALDLGSTAKAWTADVIAGVLAETLEEAALVSLGGDIRVSRPDGASWPISIAERPGDEPESQVAIDDGGLATSSTQVRHWRRRGKRVHHLIDPRTGVSASDVWRTATATGPSCVAANTASTAAIVLGQEAPTWLADRGVTARLVSRTGSITQVGDWPIEQEDTL